MKNKEIKMRKIFISVFAAIALMACSDDSPSSAFEEDDEVVASSSSKWGSSSSRQIVVSSSSWQVVESSSSQAVTYDYLTESKKMEFTFTYYKQISAGWDGTSKYTDGDPRVSFIIKFIQPNGTFTSEKTGVMLGKDNFGEWSGSKSIVFNAPALTETIQICPKVVDVDVVFDDDKSSNYCYGKVKIGNSLEDGEVIEGSDYKSSDYELEWEWYLY